MDFKSDFHAFHYEDVDNPLTIRESLVDHSGKRVFFDADRVVCENQVWMALRRTLRAERTNSMIAKEWGIEFLLHLAGTHQISEALKLVNVDFTTTRIVVLQDSTTTPYEGFQRGFPSFQATDEVLARYGVTGQRDPCKAVIAKGVSVVINHQ